MGKVVQTEVVRRLTDLIELAKISDPPQIPERSVP
jgi:hypothetical protein